MMTDIRDEITWHDLGEYAEAHRTSISGLCVQLVVNSRADGKYDPALYKKNEQALLNKVKKWKEKK